MNGQGVSDTGSSSDGPSAEKNVLNTFFGGVFSNELVAEGDRYSERFEPFHFISVPVRDRKNLLESLNSWVEGDKVSYTWESPPSGEGEVEKITLDTHKRISIDKLPDQLIIHLKRFEFDFETMQQLKLHDRFEFPMELDMYPYTKEGQAELRKRRGKADGRRSSSNAPTSEGRLLAPEYYEYELVGTVVHMGSANSGHYYSFLREHTGSEPEEEPQWYEFNDTQVTPFDVKDLPEECFGGQEDDQNTPNAVRRRKKTRSAFMLYYSRKRPQLGSEHAASSSRVSISALLMAALFLVRLKNRSRDRVDILRRQSSILAPEPIRRQILHENQLFWRKKYLFNAQYLDFTYQLLSECMSLETSSTDGESILTFTAPVEARYDALRLATVFVFGTLWQSGDLAGVVKWKSALCALYRDDVRGAQWLLSTLRENESLLIELLLSNQNTEIRELIGIVLEEAILTITQAPVIDIESESDNDSGSSERRSSTSLPSSFEFMFLLFRLMPWLLTVPMHHHQQYFAVLLGFALSGQNECAFTVVNSVVGAVVSLLTGVGNTQALLQGELKKVKGRTILKRLELDVMQLKLLSLLLRCGPPPAMDAQTESPLLPPSMATNPHAPSLPPADQEVLISERFVTLLTQRASHYSKETKPLEQIVMHLCWQSHHVTRMFFDCIFSGIEGEDHDDIKAYFRTLNTMLKIKDSLAQERLDDSMTKLVAIMASQQKYYKATEVSMDMLTRLAKRHPRSVLRWVRAHHSSCTWMSKWLLAHRGPDGLLQQGKTSLVKPNSTSSWGSVDVRSDALVRSVDRAVLKLLPRVRSLVTEDSDQPFETFYDSDDNPMRLVGKRVRVKWAKEKWYEGSVERFDERSYEHLVVYDDGDKRQYRMSDKTFYVVEAPASSDSASPPVSHRRESSSADL